MEGKIKFFKTIAFSAVYLLLNNFFLKTVLSKIQKIKKAFSCDNFTL